MGNLTLAQVWQRCQELAARATNRFQLIADEYYKGTGFTRLKNDIKRRFGD